MLCKVLLTCFIWQLWCRSYSLISVWKLRTYKTFKPCHFYDYFDKAQSKLSIPKSLFPNVAFESVNRMTHDQFTSRQQNEGTVSFLRRYFPGNQPRDDGRSWGETSAWTPTCTWTSTWTCTHPLSTHPSSKMGRTSKLSSGEDMVAGTVFLFLWFMGEKLEVLN